MIDSEKLQKIAASQAGYFTTRQAKDAGFTRDLLVYHTKQNHWLKVDRGIYRLPDYPDSLESEFVRWTLWVVGYRPERVVAVSHNSALFYYGLAASKSDAVHLTVPHLKYKQEKTGCVFHFSALDEDEVVQRSGYNLTTVVRTLQDMKPDLLLRCQWEDAVGKAQAARLISQTDADSLLEKTSAYAYAATSRFGYGQQQGAEAFVMKGESMGTTTRTQTAIVDEAVPSPSSVSTLSGDVRSPRRGNRAALRYGFAGDRSAFTLVELLVVIAIIAILAAFLMPSLSKAMEMARSATCVNNLRQLGMTLPGYCDSNKDYLPTPYLSTSGGMCWWWLNQNYDGYTDIGRTIARVKLFMCPSWNGGYMGTTTSDLWIAGTSWTYSLGHINNTAGSVKYSSIGNTSQTMLLFDNRPQSQTSFQSWVSIACTTSDPSTYNIIHLMSNIPSITGFRHPGDKAATLFADLHGSLCNYAQLENAKAVPPPQ